MNINQKAVNEIRYLAATQIAGAGSGHTGVSLGAAPIFYSLYLGAMKFSPKEADYFNRDRFVLCAGHSSSLYYSVLHAFGYPITTEDIKNYRKKGFITKGHPSCDPKFGIDASGGPLGQGIPMAVGMAIAEKKLAYEFNKPGFNIIDHHTFVFAGDGSMMEGITNEASSLAGTLELNKLIVLYDSNNITIEGQTNIAFTENVLMRYRALGWNTIEVENGEDINAIISAIKVAKASEKKPTIIKINTKIGFASPYENSAKIHGKALTQEELFKTKTNLGVINKEYTLSEDVKAYLNEIIGKKVAEIDSEKQLMKSYSHKYPKLFKELNMWLNDDYSKNINWDDFEKQKQNEATRNSSKYILNKLADNIPNLLSGSADLAPSVGTELVLKGDFSKDNIGGRNLHFGVREHAMAAICNGIMLHGGFRVACSTFMVFSDYMRHAIRMSALMKLPVIYILSHDSIAVGEDGKTHQPVEFNAMYRAMPDLNFIRPADRYETLLAYKLALKEQLPTVIALTRQEVPNLANITSFYALKGAYFVINHKNAKAIIYSSGSEVAISMQASQELYKKGIEVSVVSVPCVKLFLEQSVQYQNKIMAREIETRVVVEASNDPGLYRFIGIDGIYIGVNSYGFTGTGKELYEHFGITPKNIAKEILKRLK